MKISKKILSILLSVVMVLGVCAVAPVTVNAADDGIVWKDAEQRYEISNYAGLKEFAKIVNGTSTLFTNNSSAHAKLMNDIDASASATANAWTPIGNDDNRYTGTFDGMDSDGIMHTITGLTFNDSSANYAGLFGCVGTEGVVRNVGLEDGSITAGSYVGGVAGYNLGTIINCYNTGNVKAKNQYSYLGGLVGQNIGRIENCYNTGAVSGSHYVGGVTGWNRGTVKNCYNTGGVSGVFTVGGVIGNNFTSVTNCYSAGNVTGTLGNLGGVVGYNKGTVTNCYYDNGRCSLAVAIGLTEDTDTVKGLTTAQMTGEASDEDNTMKALYDAVDDNGEKIWLDPKADGKDNGKYYWYYPHLKGFAYDTDPTAESWPAKVEVSVTLSGGDTITYDGKDHKSDLIVTVGDSFVLTPGEDYTVSYHKYIKGAWISVGEEGAVNAGEYKAVVTFTDTGYAKGHAPIEKEFTITPKSLTSEMIADIADVTYTGAQMTPVITVTDGSNTLTEGTDYTVSYSNNVNVARDANGNVIAGAKVTVTGKGNYTDRVEKIFTITPKAVTITAKGASKPYDGSALTQSGFEASALEEGDTHEFTVVMTAGSTVTNAETKPNVIATVDGVNVTAGTATPVGNYNVTTVNGTLTVTKATAIVTITGNNNSASYDGKEHSVSGYTATASNELYDVTKDFTFSGTAEANRTDSGRTNMGLSADQFTNTNPNFDVTFNVDSDGYQNIVPLNAEVTITGNSETADYDGQEHSASGYTFAASNPLYKEGDFTFSGTAEAKLTEPGTQNMGLDASQFGNISPNFDTVTFVIAEDGKITVNPVIKFVDEDGTVLQSSVYAMGETPEYKGETPVKAASDGCTYEFAGWTPAITEVTGNATYTAVYTSTAIGLELKEGTNDTTGYKEDQTFTVDTSNLPEGAEVHWFVNGEDVGTGSSYKVEDPTEDYTVQAKVIDSDGSVLNETETQKVHVKNGFFDRIKAFFTELIAQILGKAIADLLFSVC